MEKPRDTVLDVTVKDDVDDLGHDVIVIDSVCDAGTADRLLLVGVFCDFFLILLTDLKVG